MIKGTDDTRYAFVNGIVRAKEARFLSKSHFERLINVGLDSFRSILSDTIYGGGGDFFNILKKIENEDRKFFDKYCLHNEIKDIVFLPDLFHNIKVKMKKGGEHLLYDIPPREMEIDAEMSAIISEYLKDKNSFILCAELDRLLCKRIYEKSRLSEFFFEYFKIVFDLENIRSFFRAREFENPLEIFKRVYLKYGSIPEKKFIDNLNKELSIVIREFQGTIYKTIIESGGTYLETKGSFLRLERLCEEFKLQFLKKARFYTFGVEPLFGYYQFKMAEIKKLRQVFIGKEYNIPITDLKEGIADVW